MNIRSVGLALLAGGGLLAGCASLEERLASNDPIVRRNAEYELVSHARVYGNESDRIAAINRVKDPEVLQQVALQAEPETDRAPSTIPDGLAAVAKITDQKSLASLACTARAKEVRVAAGEKVADQKLVVEVYGRALDNEVKKSLLGRMSEADIQKLPYSENLIPYWRKIGDQRKLAMIYRDGYSALPKSERTELKNKIVDEKILMEMVDKPSRYDLDKESSEIDTRRRELKDKLSEAMRMSNKRLCLLLGQQIKALENTKSKFLYVTNDFARMSLYGKLPTEKVEKLVKESIQQIQTYQRDYWSNYNMAPMTNVIVAAHVVKKNPESVVAIIGMVLENFDSHCGYLKDQYSSWGSGDERNAKQLLAKFPQLPDETIAELICSSGWWSLFIDKASADIAYKILTAGKAKSANLELALIQKLPKDKIDMAVYNGVKSDDAKKAIQAVLPPELKKQIAEAAEKAYAAVVEKAKSAAKETFELGGFYLGMTFDDMKAVFTHHFPDWQIREEIDGSGKDADYVIYIPGQKAPFCYADVEDKKVYQFNFGKKVLKKWYKYDVQTFMEWAHAYERETKIDMKFKLVEKDAEVYSDNRTYTVWFRQESYQYKHNTKEYRLTYFGEEKDYTVHGGMAGALIKEMAAPRFRYVRGDPGSLRAKIERD